MQSDISAWNLLYFCRQLLGASTIEPVIRQNIIIDIEDEDEEIAVQIKVSEINMSPSLNLCQYSVVTLFIGPKFTRDSFYCSSRNVFSGRSRIYACFLDFQKKWKSRIFRTCRWKWQPPTHFWKNIGGRKWIKMAMIWIFWVCIFVYYTANELWNFNSSFKSKLFKFMKCLK